MFRAKRSYLSVAVTKSVSFSLRKRARELSLLSFAVLFFYILRNPIRSGRNLRGGWTSAFNYNRADRRVFLQKRTLARGRINKLQRVGDAPGIFNASTELIPNNVPQTVRHAIENKTPSTPGAFFLRTDRIFLWGVHRVLWPVHRESLIPSRMSGGGGSLHLTSEKRASR